MKLGYFGRACMAALIAYALLSLSRILFEWMPFGEHLGMASLGAGALFLARDIARGDEHAGHSGARPRFLICVARACCEMFSHLEHIYLLRL
jgi:hypothetical protein